MTVEPESEMPGLRSEHNLPSPSAILRIIWAAWACPVIASDKALSNGTPNGTASKASHLETFANGVASKGDYQHTPTNDTVVSKESSPMSNSSGHSNDHSNPKSSIASATSTTSISDTPSNIPNPTVNKLEDLSIGLNFYNFYPHDYPYLPLLTLGAPDYTLSILPIYPQSLDSAPSSQGYYHHLLRLTRLRPLSFLLPFEAICRCLYRSSFSISCLSLFDLASRFMSEVLCPNQPDRHNHAFPCARLPTYCLYD
ncbi:hypothetical protein BGZ57DRAFT_856111 [Hyaloscypha finlandica]|nr:hypothetical protein BGZ57DRAFT_856111 [Hyaloscypha finlandica]